MDSEDKGRSRRALLNADRIDYVNYAPSFPVTPATSPAPLWDRKDYVNYAPSSPVTPATSPAPLWRGKQGRVWTRDAGIHPARGIPGRCQGGAGGGKGSGVEVVGGGSVGLEAGDDVEGELGLRWWTRWMDGRRDVGQPGVFEDSSDARW